MDASVALARGLARWVLLAAGAAALAGGLAGVVARESVEAGYELAYGAGGADRGRIAVLAGLGLAVAAAGCCGYAAQSLRRGVVWLVCALVAAGLAPALFGRGTIVAPRIVGPGASAAEIGADVAAEAPRWYVPATAGLAMLGVCAALLAAMLVALPPRPRDEP
ncbi:hypothetical protein [Dactylosporangium sp. CA-233914]|uniref:hypothetical protein n=1 Tax=Dactylosporangium sp. CA-233914 TaxID=3239934 RepID=UPI003D92FF02